MLPHNLFSLASAMAMVGWIVLIFAPKSKAADLLIYRAGLPLAFSILYVAALATGGLIPGGGFGSIPEVRTLFTSDWALLAGWVHYLAFDMYIGGILSKKMAEQGFSTFLRAPILVLTFMFGPVGFLVYSVAVRSRNGIRQLS